MSDRQASLAAVIDAHTVSLTLKAVWWADNPGPSCHAEYLSHTVFVREGNATVSLSGLRQALAELGLHVED